MPVQIIVINDPDVVEDMIPESEHKPYLDMHQKGVKYAKYPDFDRLRDEEDAWSKPLLQQEIAAPRTPMFPGPIFGWEI